MNKLFIVILGALVVLGSNTACNGVPFLAQNEPTATATRRIRPTFTPKPRATPTEELPPTDEPTETDEPKPTDEPATETPKPVTKAPTKPAAPKATQTPKPTDVPKPQFSINITKDSDKYFCAEQGSSVFEVVSSVKKGKTWAGGYYMAALDPGGRLLTDGAGKNLIGESQSEFSVSIGSNCRVSADFENPNTSNAKIDVGDAVRQGNTKLLIRFIKSPTDLTPLSPDFAVDFGQSGRWWIYVQVK
ncbi:MAG: hypothetical protein HY741_28745 [Chloroflexi bacterium]|nr:hypothetical protein [Chloroflexota bacterium]